VTKSSSSRRGFKDHLTTRIRKIARKIWKEKSENEHTSFTN